jgi:hypothetical protein
LLFHHRSNVELLDRCLTAWLSQKEVVQAAELLIQRRLLSIGAVLRNDRRP